MTQRRWALIDRTRLKMACRELVSTPGVVLVVVGSASDGVDAAADIAHDVMERDGFRVIRVRSSLTMPTTGKDRLLSALKDVLPREDDSQVPRWLAVGRHLSEVDVAVEIVGEIRKAGTPRTCFVFDAPLDGQTIAPAHLQTTARIAREARIPIIVCLERAPGLALPPNAMVERLGRMQVSDVAATLLTMAEFQEVPNRSVVELIRELETMDGHSRGIEAQVVYELVDGRLTGGVA